MKFGPVLAATIMLALAAPAAAQPTTPVKLDLAYDGVFYPLSIPIKVLDAHLTQQSSATGFSSTVQMKSYGLLAAIKRVDLDASAQGQLDGGAPRPGVFNYHHHDGARVRHVVVSWGRGEVQVTSTPTYMDLGNPPASGRQKLDSADPLTQLMRLTLASSREALCDGNPLFFDGKQLYRLEFGHAQSNTPSARARALGVTSIIQCTVRYVEVAGFHPKPAAQKNEGLTSPIHVLFGKLGEGGPWVVVSLGANTKYGLVSVNLHAVDMGGRGSTG
jgi:hypothetical protein